MRNSMTEITELIKDYLSSTGFKGKVKDSDVAEALTTEEAPVTPGSLGTCKSRDVVPYQAISLFCARHLLSINYLLYMQDPHSILKNSDSLMIHHYHLASWIRTYLHLLDGDTPLTQPSFFQNIKTL